MLTVVGVFFFVRALRRIEPILSEEISVVIDIGACFAIYNGVNFLLSAFMFFRFSCCFICTSTNTVL